ncbi:MAG: DUF2934 domain-containing protein [Candidatus Acidiferrales bacterium]
MMSGQAASPKLDEQRCVSVTFGNALECLKVISEATAKRANEIFQRQGCPAGREQDHLRLAEEEILQPLSCGVLESKDEVTVSMFCSALGARDIEEIEVCVEPRRMILAGKKRSSSGEVATFFRVLPLKDEFDPSSGRLKLKHRGSLLEIQIRKARKDARVESQAA